MSDKIISDTYIGNGEEIEFNYYSRPSMSKKLSFVKSVVDTVCGDDYYYPMIKDMTFDFCLIEFFSDIVVADDNEDTIDYVEEFLANNNAATVMKLGMDFDVVQELYENVDKMIEYKTGIHSSPIADAISKVIDTLEQKFAGIDVDAMTGMANVFGKLQGDITPEKMLEAYAKSDVFKKQAKEVVANQKKRDEVADKVLENAKKNNDFTVVDGKDAAVAPKKISTRKTSTRKKTDAKKTDNNAE